MMTLMDEGGGYRRSPELINMEKKIVNLKAKIVDLRPKLWILSQPKLLDLMAVVRRW